MGIVRPSRRLGRPPADELPEGERRARILHAAGDLFTQRGYAAVSLGDIAAQVGITKAAIYHHFQNKDDLFTAVMCEVLELIRGSILLTIHQPIPLQLKIRQLAAAAILGVRSDADLEAMMRDADAQLAPAQRELIETAHRGVLQAVEELMRDGLAQGELRGTNPALLAYAFWHLIGSFAGLAGTDGGFQGREETVDAVVGLFLHGAIATPSRAGAEEYSL